MIFLILDARAQWCAFNIVTRAKAPQWFFFNFFYFTMDADRAKENASKHPYSCTTVSHLIIRAPFMTQTSLRLPFLSLQTQQRPHAASPRQVQLLAAGGPGFMSNCSLFISVWTCFSLACSQAAQVRKITPWHHSRRSLSRPIWMIQRITHRRSAIGLWLRWLLGFSPHDVMKERWQKATWRKVHYKSSIPWYTRKSLKNMLYDYSTELWLKQENAL